MTAMADEIVLTIPREPDFQHIAHLVLGGLAVRMDLTVESLEDLQLALDALLDDAVGGEVSGTVLTVRMRLTDDALDTVIGPLSPRVLKALRTDDGNELGVRRVLASTVDDVALDGDSVRLTKKVRSG